MKILRNRMWFKSRRGGTGVSSALDHPTQREKVRGKDVSTPGGEKEGKGRVKVVETPIFIPYTKDSALRKKMQEADDRIGEVTNVPAVRFVERCGGGTIIELLGSSNPWAKDWSCNRKGCLPCEGRLLLAGEEEMRPVPKEGELPRPKPAREETVSSPKCTNEGAGYMIECWPCRLEGKTFKYIGETSRSPF